jgi:hypothetical protein
LPSRKLVNVIFVPSGDQLGVKSFAAFMVSRDGLEPSKFAV